MKRLLSTDELEALREYRREHGTAAVAAELGIPAPSLRRILSTGAPGRNYDRIVELVGNESADATGIELDESELEELAELWKVPVDDVEDLLEMMPPSYELMTLPDAREYIDALFEALEDQGWDGEISDLWDLFYGYSPGSRR